MMLGGLIGFSSMGGPWAVICQDDTGHIAVEPVIHDHCACPEEGEGGDHEGSASVAWGASSDHEHCRDYAAGSDIIAQARKDLKSSGHKAWAGSISLRVVSADVVSALINRRPWSCELLAFYTPLRTIVLRA